MSSMSPNLYANTPGGGFPTNTNQAGGGFLYNNLVGGGYRNPWGGFNQYGLGQVQPPQPVYGPINPVQQAGDGMVWNVWKVKEFHSQNFPLCTAALCLDGGDL